MVAGPALIVMHFGTCRSLPRIGLHFGVPKGCEQVQWYGAGPHECYWDRKSGAPVREYSSTVKDMHVPYIVPGKIWPCHMPAPSLPHSCCPAMNDCCVQAL